MIKEVSCGIIPLYKNPNGAFEVLVIQHEQGRYWSFPKGHVEPGETYMQTAMRECKEETGLEFVTIDEKMFSERYSFSRKDDIIDKHVNYFVGITEHREITIETRELRDYVRLTLGDVGEQLTFLSDRQLRDKVLTYLTNK